MKKRNSSFLAIKCLFFLLLLFSDIRAQTIQYSIKVDEVDLQAPIGMDNHKISIKRDYDPNPLITGVAWKAPDIQTPVAFYSGVAARVTAKFYYSRTITMGKRKMWSLVEIL